MKLSLPRAPALLETHRSMMERSAHQDNIASLSSSSQQSSQQSQQQQLSQASQRAAGMRVTREADPRGTTTRAAMAMTTAPNPGNDQQHWLLLQQQQQQQQYGGERPRGDASGTVDQRSVLARVLGTASDQQQQPMATTTTRGAYMNMNGGGGVYGRLSEPTHTIAEETRGLEAEGLRRSLPSTQRGDVAQDMSWALQSIQEQSRGNNSRPVYLMQSSSSSSLMARNPRQFMGSSSAGPPSSLSNNRPAYQLSRAHSADVMQQRTEPVDEVAQLKQMIMALQRNLADECKRRATDSKQYESRIFELQTLIRRNMPEQRRELERNMHSTNASLALQQAPSVPAAACPTRTPQQQSVPPATSRARALRSNQNAAVPGPYVAMRQLSEMEKEELDQNGGADSEGGETNEAPGQAQEDNAQDNQRNSELAAVRQVKIKFKKKITDLRALMRTEVAHAAGEVTVLNQRLEEERNEHARKERQLQERVVFLEERRRHAKQKLQNKIALLNTELLSLKDENQRLEELLHERELRIQQLELAVGGRNIVAAYQKTGNINSSNNSSNNNNTAEYR